MPASRSIATNRALRFLTATFLGLGTSWSAAALATAPLLDRPDVQLIANGNVTAMTRLPDGAVVLGGTFQSVNGEARRGIAKMKTDGTLDETFHPDVHYSVDVLASDATGTVYAGGTFMSIDGVTRRYLAKLDGESGAVDPDWDPSPDGFVKAIAVNAAGDVFVAGTFTTIGGAARNLIAKLSGNGAGAADAAWDPDPTGGMTTAINAMTASGADLYVAGSFDSIGGRSRTDLAKLSTTGSGAADASWNPVPYGGSSNYHSVSSIAIDATGNVYVAGIFIEINGTPRETIAKLSGSGSGAVDGAWDAGIVWPYAARHVVAGDDGAIYVLGTFPEIGGAARAYLAKLSAETGDADTSWDAHVANNGGDEPVHDVLAASDGTVFVGGAFFWIGGQSRLAFAVLGVGGTATDNLTDVEAPGYVNALLGQPDGGIVVAGEFAKADGLSRPHILRIAADGLLDAAWNPGIDYTVNTLAQDSIGNVYAGGKFEHAGGLPRLHIARITAAGAVDASWNPSAPDAPSNLVSVDALAIDAEDNLYVGGYFTQFGGLARGALAKLDSAGNVDATWNPGVATEFPSVYALGLDGDSIYVGGTFHHAGGVARENLAKLAVTGSGAADAAWDPAPDGWIIYDVIPDHAGSVYVDGSFTEIGGEARNGLAKLEAGGTGAADAGWNPILTATPNTLAFDGTYVYASVYDFNLGTTIVRFGAECAGAADVDWNPVMNDSVYAMANGTDGSMLVGGRFTETEGSARGGLAAFDAASISECPGFDDRIFADDFDG